MFAWTLRLKLLVLAVLVIAGCSGEPGDEELGSLEQATTQVCGAAPLAGECRYTPVATLASSVESSGYPAQNATDGNCTTRWSSAFSDPQWLKVDLGSRRRVSRVVVRWESAYSKNYQIQVSDNATDWTTVATHANASVSGSGNSRVDTVSGLTASGRYVRLNSLQRATSYGHSIFEFEVFGTDCGAPEGCSLIPVFPVSASASSSEHSGKTPDKAIDGSYSTRWGSAFSDPQWIRLDLGVSQTFSRVIVDWEAATSGKYEIQVSESTSGPWTVVHTRTDNRQGPRTDDISGLAATGRYMRLYSTKRTTSYGNSIFEIKLFREACETCEQVLVPSSVRASSKESDAYAASKAVDGDFGTRWSSQFSDPQWLELDFGAERRVKQVIIKWEGAASKTYRLQTAASSSGPWTEIALRSNMPAGPRVDVISELDAAGRFLRIYSTARTGSYGNSIYEVLAIGAKNPLACGGDCLLGDTDSDDVADCFDECPRDPAKTTPGICDCGTPDTDSNGNGVPNCKESCGSTTCGCPTAPAAAGTPCSDGACPGILTCNGAGSCGDPNACKPAPSCVAKPLGERWYWFCTGSFSWQDARTRCGTVQATLASLGSATENAFVAANLPAATAWIGASDLAVNGKWRWANITAEGARFWNGDAGGKPWFATYANWSSGSPAAAHGCGAMASGGRWLSDVCSAGRGFVCEATSQRTDKEREGPIVKLPTPVGPCQNEDDVFAVNGDPMTEAEFEAALNACNDACEVDPDRQACDDACNGPLEIPTGNNCADFSDVETEDFCVLQSVTVPPRACASDADCLDPGTVCGRYYDCRQLGAPKTEFDVCFSDNRELGEVGSGYVCGVPAPGCPRVADVDWGTLCGGSEICVDDAMKQELVDPFTDDTFASTPFEPLDYFTEPAEPDPTLPYPDQSNPCNGSCEGTGEEHPWCHLGVGEQLPSAPEVTPNKAGNSGGDLVSFSVDPRLRLTYTANIGPFGLPQPLPGEEHGLNVTAEAGFLASVHYNLFYGGTLDIVDLMAKATAHECGIETDVKLSIFEQDFLPVVEEAGLPVDFPDTGDTTRCEAAFAALHVAGDRAKKALRDVSDLLTQYKTKLADDNVPANTANNLHPNTCALLMDQTPRGFPKVDCETKTVEDAINAYIEYYRRSVLGFAGQDFAGAQLKGIMEAASDFAANALNYAPTAEIPIFTIPGRDEEVTIAEFQFFIGPVPVNLEVLSQINYDATISLQVGFQPSGVIDQILLNNGSQERSRLFYVQANGAPQAGVALAAFAGVGFGVPGFTAKLGIESALTLANVSVPAHAGAGLTLGAIPEEERPLPADLEPLSTGNMLLTPKQFVLGFDYGAGLGIKLRNILGGEVRGKLKLKVLFFSKTWRKTLLHFDGICPGPYNDNNGILGDPPCYIPLIAVDGSEQVATGDFPWGVVRPTTPFVELEPLTPGAMVLGTVGVQNFRPAERFYDSQCTCIERDDPERECFRDKDCCDNDVCFKDPGTGVSECTGCRVPNDTCYEDGDCCLGASECLVPESGVGPRTCRLCQHEGFFCEENNDCCPGTSCFGGVCRDRGFCDDACEPRSEFWTPGDNQDCQGALVCREYTLQPGTFRCRDNPDFVGNPCQVVW